MYYGAMRRSLLCLIWVSAALLAASPARAHHSFESEYNSSRPVTISGKVTKLLWQNPHGRRRLPSPAMCPARCVSFFSTRLRNRGPTEASNQPAQSFLQKILGRDPVGFCRKRWRRPIPATDLAVDHRAVRFLGQNRAKANAVVCECIRAATLDVNRALRRSQPPDPPT